jgi:hypothetical protein
MALQLSEHDLSLLKHNPGGIYCIALRDEVWQAQLDADVDHDESSAYPKVYVGQSGASVGIKLRVASHYKALRNGKHHNPHLQHVFNLHGEDALEAYVIESCSDSELDRAEETWIWRFNAHGIHGYNIAVHASARCADAGQQTNIGLKSPPQIAEKSEARRPVPRLEASIAEGSAAQNRAPGSPPLSEERNLAKNFEQN